MTAVKHVNATFDGEKRRFEIKRERVQAFEARLRRAHSEDDIEMGASAYASLRRLHKGGWTATDIEETLAFGLETQTEEQYKLQGIASHVMKSLEAVPGALKPAETYDYFTRPDIMPAIKRDGHAAYVELSAMIITACLFGITEAEADFDEWKLNNDE